MDNTRLTTPCSRSSVGSYAGALGPTIARLGAAALTMLPIPDSALNSPCYSLGDLHVIGNRSTAAPAANHLRYAVLAGHKHLAGSREAAGGVTFYVTVIIVALILFIFRIFFGASP